MVVSVLNFIIKDKIEKLIIILIIKNVGLEGSALGVVVIFFKFFAFIIFCKLIF